MTWVLALNGLGCEPSIVRSLADCDPSTRRVSDIVELLALARPELADVVLVSSRFPQMNRDVALRIATAGVPCWGIVDRHDDSGARQCEQWGLPVLPVSPDSDVAALLTQARLPDPAPRDLAPVIAVTGPPGSTGRTTVATNLAAQWGSNVLLVDADPVAPAIAFHCGLPSGTPGLLGAARAVAVGRLDPAALLSAASPWWGVAVLPGAPPGEAAGAVSAPGIWEAAGGTGVPVIVDCGPDLGGAQVHPALARATVVVSVASPTALGVRRWADGAHRLRESSAAPITVVWNQVPGPRRRASGVMDGLARIVAQVCPAATVAGLPRDDAAVTRLDRRAVPLRKAAPRAPLTRALDGLASSLRSAVTG